MSNRPRGPEADRQRVVRALIASGAVALATASAQAQDYTVTATSGLYETPPANATVLANFSDSGQIRNVGPLDDGFVTVNLPFDFPFFGRTYRTFRACTNGFIMFNPSKQIQPLWKNTAFPPAVTVFHAAPALDGICAPLWDDLTFVYQGDASKWTSGTAPNRKFVFQWTHVQEFMPSPGQVTTPVLSSYTNSSDMTFQVQLFETNGRIVFAYADGGTWPSFEWEWGTLLAPGMVANQWNLTSSRGDYSIGIDSETSAATAGDDRWVEPAGLINPYNDGRPPNDYQFDPVVRTYTGRLLVDRPVVDASGIGNSTQYGVPLAGVTVALRWGTATPCSVATDADGYFTIKTAGLDHTVTDASVVVTTQDPAYAVTSVAGGAPFEATLASGVSFAQDQDFGTITIGSAADPSGTVRAALNIECSVHDVYAWAAARTLDDITPLEIVFDANAGTSYTAALTGAVQLPATMHVSGASSNPDAWDSAIVRRVYARHILASIAGSPTTLPDYRFDAVSDAENAFAEAFGYYLNAVVTGTHQVIDGISSSSAKVYELEDPVASSPKRDDVAAWMAACLHDLTDGANEPWDQVDGTGVANERPFLVIDSLSGAVTGPRFAQGWYDAGYATAASSVLFIHYGLTPDDDDEPNDDAAHATVPARFGFRRAHRVLNLANEDWCSFTLAHATASLQVDVVYDRSRPELSAALEIQDLVGTLLARGAFAGPVGPLHAATGPLPAGVYRARIVNGGTAPIGDYGLQAYVAMTISGSEFPAWTVNRPYDVSVPLGGGVEPYALSVGGLPYLNPPGLTLDGPANRVHGVPQNVGTFSFVLTAADDGGPQHSTSAVERLVINPELALTVGEFLTFAQGKPFLDRHLSTGGTAPYTVIVESGALPDGVTMAPGEIRFEGAATVAGSTPTRLAANDVAGSASSVDTTNVVCVPFGTTPLADGPSACGFWFDAVLGSKASIAFTTSKKHVRRALRVVVVGPDGTSEVPVVVKARLGKASVPGFVAPATGRFYCVAASDAGAASQLAAKAVLSPPTSGKGDNGPDNFVSGNELPVQFGALAGARLTFTAKPDKSGLQTTVVRLTDPTGADVPFAVGEVVEKKGAITVKTTLSVSGTWTLVLGAKPGPQGHFAYSFSLKEPKGVAYAE